MSDYEEISKVAEIMAGLSIKEIEASTLCLKERVGMIEPMARTHSLVAEKLTVKLIDALYAYHDLAATRTMGES